VLQAAILLLVLAVVAGIVGYGGVAAQFAGVAQILFIVFVVLFLISAVASAMRGRPPGGGCSSARFEAPWPSAAGSPAEKSGRLP